MRRYPQPGLSRAISSTSARTAAAVRGRPGFWRGRVQRLRTRLACRRSTVRGETIRPSRPSSPRGSSRASAARTARQPMRTSQPRGGLVRSWLFSRLTRCQGKSRLTLVQRNPVNAAGSSTVGAGRSVVRDSLGPGASGAAAAGDAADGDAGPRERQRFTPYRACQYH